MARMGRLGLPLARSASCAFARDCACAPPFYRVLALWALPQFYRDRHLLDQSIFKSLTEKKSNDDVILFEPYNRANRVNIEEQKKNDLDIRKIKYYLSSLSLKGNVEAIKGSCDRRW